MAKMVSRLRAIADGADDAVAEAVAETANFILSLIRSFVPVRTGALKASYTKEKITRFHILIGSMVNYAVFQEFGTSRQSGKPHIVPAFAQAEDYFRQKFIDRVKSLG